MDFMFFVLSHMLKTVETDNIPRLDYLFTGTRYLIIKRSGKN